jgi:CheY-like chemotaxis protein
MHELGYSRRQFFREQRKAIAMLSALLQDKLPPQETQVEADKLLDGEAARVLAQREAVDPAEIACGTLETVSNLARQHNVTLERNLDPRLPPIRGSRTLLRQVFLEVLSSLISHPGAQRVRLQMRHIEQTRSVIAEWIIESGTPDYRPDMEPARHLVEMAGGHWQGIEVTHQGCTVRFDLPTVSEQVLLVIEDNEAVIRAFRRYLAGYDYRVVGATNGVQALQFARHEQPTAITLDVMMPSQDGWELLQALKDDPVTRRIPVIICSVLENPELARSLGAVAYLRKPVAQAHLLSTLDDLPQ